MTRRDPACNLNQTIVRGLILLAVVMVVGALVLAALKIPLPEWIGQSVMLTLPGLLALANSGQRNASVAAPPVKPGRLTRTERNEP